MPIISVSPGSVEEVDQHDIHIPISNYPLNWTAESHSEPSPMHGNARRRRLRIRVGGSLTTAWPSSRRRRFAEVVRCKSSGVGSQLVGPSRRADPTLGQYVRAVGHGQHRVHVLLDQKHANTGVASDGGDCREEAFHDDWAETEAQLVDHKESRTAHQGTGNGQHLLLAARHLSGGAIDDLLKFRKESQGPLDGLSVAAPRREPEVFAAGEPEEQCAILGHVRDAAANQGQRVGCRISSCQPRLRLAEHVDLARNAWKKPGDREEHRRLTGPVRAQQRDDLARVDVQIDVAYDRYATVPRRQLANVEGTTDRRIQ